MVETTIILQGTDAKKWTMMNMLESVGFFNIQYGRCTIDFDGEGKVEKELETDCRLYCMTSNEGFDTFSL